MHFFCADTRPRGSRRAPGAALCAGHSRRIRQAGFGTADLQFLLVLCFTDSCGVCYG